MGHREAAARPQARCMILLDAVVFGFVAGGARAGIRRRPYRLDLPGRLDLLFAAALLQSAVFYFPPTRTILPDWLVSCLLVSTQIVLLVFVWLNRAQPGFWLLGAGLGLNLLVIVANGGWMPVSPQVISALFSDVSGAALELGERVGWSKDILLLPTQTRLWWLSDCMLLPSWFPQQAAFSLGDVLIAIGAFWALWIR